MGCGVCFFCRHLMPRDCRDPGRTIDRSRKFHYLATMVPGTCRLQTKVTVKPGSRRLLSNALPVAVVMSMGVFSTC